MPNDFLIAFSEDSVKMPERCVALLWWHGLEEPTVAIPIKQLCEELEKAGYSKQNTSRMRTALAKDKRTSKGSDDTFRIRINARKSLDDTYLQYVKSRPVKHSDSVIPLELFNGTRGYLEKVVLQLNASYDEGLYDCCAVMCRRLLETLIIETYESKNASDSLKGADGNFLMFSGLLSVVQDDSDLNIGRVAMQGLRDFKRLGDSSAHNRRFNARKNDIDRIRDGLRIASEELLHLANLIS